MRKIILSFLILSLLLISLASATVTQTNVMKYGILQSGGTLTTTETGITEVNILGFVCSASDCSSTSGTLFSGNVLNTGSSSQISLQFPTQLQDQGYGLFFYKNGYIPYEVKSTFSGSGAAPTGTRYLAKAEVCKPILKNLRVSNSSSEIIVKADVDSPISHAGPLNLIPNSIKDQYLVNVKVDLEVTGAANTSETKTINLEFSESKEAEFRIPANPGIYNIKLQSSTNDEKCLSSQSDEESQEYTISQPPIIQCSSDSQCNDNNPLTYDSCQNPGTSQSQCIHTPIACNANSDCNDNNQSTTDICNNPGTQQSYCENTPTPTIACSTDAQCSDGNPLTYDQCIAPGTENSECKNTPIACASNSDCGTSGFFGNKFCSVNIVKQLFITYTCNNPGQLNAQCISGSQNQTLQTCSDFCSNGQCQTFQCTQNSDCFSILNLVAESLPFCKSGDVYKEVATPVCNNPATPNAQCTSNTQEVLVESCNFGCNNGQCLQNPVQPISLEIISPENKTYNTTEILVNIQTTNATLVKYSINGGANITYISPLTLTFPEGANILVATASNSQNALSKSVSFSVNTTGNQTSQDTTPPGTVTNLILIDKGTSFLKWSWMNPGDSDFKNAIVYLNGVNVVNTSSNMYFASGLNSNTTYTITLYTQDINGNINTTGISNTAITDADSNNGGGNGGGSGGGSSGGKKKTQQFPDLTPIELKAPPVFYEDFGSLNLSSNKQQSTQIKIDWKLFLWILLLLSLLLLIIIVVVLLIKASK